MPKFCDYCGGEIKGGNGGLVYIPMELSNRPGRKVDLHNCCLNPFISKTEKDRPPLPQFFQPQEIEAEHQNDERKHSHGKV